MGKPRLFKNKSSNTADKLKAVEGKFERIQQAIQAEYPDQPIIAYLPDGLIILGDPVGIAKLYMHHDQEFQEVLAKDIFKGIPEHIVEQIINHNCGNEDCPVHGEKK